MNLLALKTYRELMTYCFGPSDYEDYGGVQALLNYWFPHWEDFWDGVVRTLGPRMGRWDSVDGIVLDSYYAAKMESYIKCALAELRAGQKRKTLRWYY